MAAEDSGSSRKSINLTPKGKRALDDLVDWEFGANETDAVNRALVLAAFLMGEQAAGATVQVARANEVPQVIVFL